MVGNPGEKSWINDPNTDKSNEDSGKYFKIPNLRSEEEYLDLSQIKQDTTINILTHITLLQNE